MRIRQPWLIRAAGLAGAGVLRLWLGSLQYHYQATGPDVDPRRPDLAGRYIYAMWHETLLLPIQRYARPDICVLISQHSDGELIAEVCRRLGVRVVRGSTTRGGAEALRGLLREGERVHLALTPDGPRGPRRVVKSGLVYLASQLRLPIVPVGFGFQRAYRAASWDRFAIPLPGSRATCVTGRPIGVPTCLDRDQLEGHRSEVQDAMSVVTASAEQWARTGRWVPGAPAEASAAA